MPYLRSRAKHANFFWDFRGFSNRLDKKSTWNTPRAQSTLICSTPNGVAFWSFIPCQIVCAGEHSHISLHSTLLCWSEQQVPKVTHNVFTAVLQLPKHHQCFSSRHRPRSDDAHTTTIAHAIRCRDTHDTCRTWIHARATRQLWTRSDEPLSFCTSTFLVATSTRLTHRQPQS